MLKTPNELGVTAQALMGASYFDNRWPVLAGILRGKIVVCHVLESKMTPLRMRIHAWQVRDVGRVRSFADLLGEARGKGRATSLSKLVSGVLFMNPTRSIEQQARCILHLYESALGEIEGDARRKPGRAIPMGLGASTLVPVDYTGPITLFSILPTEFIERAEKAGKAARWASGHSRNSSVSEGGRDPQSLMQVRGEEGEEEDWAHGGMGGSAGSASAGANAGSTRDAATSTTSPGQIAGGATVPTMGHTFETAVAALGSRSDIPPMPTLPHNLSPRTLALHDAFSQGATTPKDSFSSIQGAHTPSSLHVVASGARTPTAPSSWHSTQTSTITGEGTQGEPTPSAASVAGEESGQGAGGQVEKSGEKEPPESADKESPSGNA